MFRKTLIIFSLVGLILSMGLWLVSYWRLHLRTDDHALGFLDGCIFVVSNPTGVFLDDTKRWGGFHRFETVWKPCYRYYPDPLNKWILGVPLWMSSSIFAVIFMCSFPFGRRNREKKGLCINCGYDLRGSKERCPECNTPKDDRH